MAQPPVDNEPPPTLLGALGDIRRAYRGGVTADDVVVTVTPRAGEARSNRLVVRIDCAGIGAEADPRRVLLEMGPLRVYIAEGRLVATHLGDPATFFDAVLVGPVSPLSIGEHLPPVPAPQLAFAAADEAAAEVPTPYTKGVTWTDAARDLAALPPLVRVNGHGFDGPVSIAAENRTGRITGFKAEFPGPDGVARLELACRPIDPGDPAQWAPSLEGRTRVGSLAELRSAAARAELRPGDSVPEMTVQSSDLVPWSLHAAMRGAPGAPAVLLLFRVPADADRAASIESDARAGLEAMRAARRGSSEAPGEKVVERAGAVIELGSFNAGAFRRLAEQWGSTPGDPRLDSDVLLWTSSGALTIDRFSREAQAVLAVIGSDRTLARVIRLDGRAGGRAEVASELRAALAPK